MSTTDRAPQPAAPPPANPGMTETDLAEVLSAFNDVTAKLHSSHEALRGEVARLRRELESANEQLERSRRLAALGEMAAGIAHEVRNPLGSIRLYARMLEQDLPDRPAERTLAEKIGAAVRGVDAVVTDVLAFARETTIRPEAVDASDLLGAAVEECLADERTEGALHRRHAADVRVARLDAAPGRTPVGLECDVSLLHRALVNVIRNGLQAMVARTKADDRPLVLTLDARERERQAVLTVRDTGPGIEPEVLHRMFNPFFTTRATGTGLGLAIVHRIVDAHGGRVSVRNAEAHEPGGRGAVVEIVLPVSPASARTPEIVTRPADASPPLGAAVR